MKICIHPREILIEDVLAEAGLNGAKAAEILGVGRSALSALLNGRASLSPEIALRFEKAFGTSMDLMLKMQLQHDISKSIKVQKWKRTARAWIYLHCHRNPVNPDHRGTSRQG